MDFVVVGLGLGALVVLWGVFILGWVTTRWERLAARATSPEAVAYGLAIAADRRDAGQACLYGGGAILLATIGALAGSLDDRTGALLVATTATVAAVGFLLWRYLHRSRRPLPPRRRAQASPFVAAAGAAAAAAAPAPLRVVPWWDEADDEIDADGEPEETVVAAPDDVSDPVLAGEAPGDEQAGDANADEPPADSYGR